MPTFADSERLGFKTVRMSLFPYSSLSLCALVLVLHADAQPVFTGGELARTPGFTYSGHSCGPLSFPSTGAGLTWNYSTETCGMENVPMFIVEPAGVTGASLFPAATAAEQYEGESGGRFHASSDTEEIYLGYYAFAGENSICSDPRTDIVYPLTYGTTFTDSMVCDEASTYSRTRYGEATITCVGYGTLILPYATFTDCLLLHRHWTYFDDYDQLVPGYVLGDAYSFFHAGIPVPLYNVSYSTYTQGDSTIINHGSSMLDELSTSTLLLHGLHDGATVWPNPTTSDIVLTRTTTHAGRMDILASDGRVLRSERIGSGQSQHRTSLSELPSGVYSLRVMDDSGSSVLRVAKE